MGSNSSHGAGNYGIRRFRPDCQAIFHRSDFVARSRTGLGTTSFGFLQQSHQCQPESSLYFASLDGSQAGPGRCCFQLGRAGCGARWACFWVKTHWNLLKPGHGCQMISYQCIFDRNSQDCLLHWWDPVGFCRWEYQKYLCAHHFTWNFCFWHLKSLD